MLSVDGLLQLLHLVLEIGDLNVLPTQCLLETLVLIVIASGLDPKQVSLLEDVLDMAYNILHLICELSVPGDEILDLKSLPSEGLILSADFPLQHLKFCFLVFHGSLL